jgi:tetratricopeptide (TPR) repeat protein
MDSKNGPNFMILLPIDDVIRAIGVLLLFTIFLASVMWGWKFFAFIYLITYVNGNIATNAINISEFADRYSYLGYFVLSVLLVGLVYFIISIIVTKIFTIKRNHKKAIIIILLCMIGLYLYGKSLVSEDLWIINLNKALVIGDDDYVDQSYNMLSAISSNSSTAIPKRTLIKIGAYYFNRKNFDRASFYLSDAVQQESSEHAAFFLLALSNAKLGNYHIARNNYKIAIELSKNNSEYEIFNALNDYNLNKLEKSRVILEKTVLNYREGKTHLSDGTYAVANFGLSTYWLLKKNYKKADEYIDISSRLTSQNEYDLFMIQKAYILKKMGNNEYHQVVQKLLTKSKKFGEEYRQNAQRLSEVSVYLNEDESINKNLIKINTEIASMLENK